jgi:hypothetical protein
VYIVALWTWAAAAAALSGTACVPWHALMMTSSAAAAVKIESKLHNCSRHRSARLQRVRRVHGVNTQM